MLTDIAAPIIVLFGMALICGLGLVYVARRFVVKADPLVEKVNALLPQTQCGQCEHPGCRPYAESIIQGERIDKCPPGGQSTINAIAKLLDVEAPSYTHSEDVEPKPMVARIIESQCIGCTKCIEACPVDAILGASKQMHTVIVDECTGCDLCIEPCPVDCIEMVEFDDGRNKWHWPKPATDQPSRVFASDQMQNAV